MKKLSQKVKLALTIQMLDVILQTTDDSGARFAAKVALDQMGDSYVPDKDGYYFVPWHDDRFILPRC